MIPRALTMAALLPTPTPMGGQAHRASEPPPLPVRGTTGLMSESSTRHRDAEHFARVRDQEITCPLCERWSARGNGMVARERAHERPIFGFREPNEEPFAARVRHRGASGSSHDFLISQIQTRPSRETNPSQDSMPLPHVVHRVISLPPDPPPQTQTPDNDDDETVYWIGSGPPASSGRTSRYLVPMTVPGA